MKPVDEVERRLRHQTRATESDWTQDDSSFVVYELVFTDQRGYDWIKGQVMEAASKCNTDVQMWKLGYTKNGFTVSVKELEPRHSIDDSQATLFE